MSYYLILRGPPAVGKTSIANSLRSTLKGKTVHIDIDKLRMMPYRCGGSEEEKALANRNAIDLCLNFVEAGYRVILDELFYQRELIDEIEQRVSYPHQKILFTCSLETCLRRNQGREYQLKNEQLERLYNQVMAVSLPQEIKISTERDLPTIVDDIVKVLSPLNKS